MAIINPDNRFRVVMKIWVGNYGGEQPLYSAPQDGLPKVIQLVKGIQRTPLHTLVRSYVIQEEVVTKTYTRWETLDYSDWCDL